MFNASRKIRWINKLGQSRKCQSILSTSDLNLLKDCVVTPKGCFEKCTVNCNGLPSYSHSPATICSENAQENKV